MKYRLCEICKCRVATSLYLEGRGEGVSVEEGETPLDPPLQVLKNQYDLRL